MPSSTNRAVKADITMIAARAMKHATGHEALDDTLRLFRLGYMLYIVKRRKKYTLETLADVLDPTWDFPGDDFKDPELPNRVQDMVFFPCHLIERTSNAAVEAFYNDDHNPHVMPDGVRRYLNGYNHDGKRSLPHRERLDISIIVSVMCAEIWCAWASRNPSTLPPQKEFMRLFGSTDATNVKLLTNRLKRISKKDKLWEHLCLFYTADVEFLANPDALIDFANNAQGRPVRRGPICV
ncbi:hypothetical protein F4680DRAFT_446754 [Xylaria scruposa]|nr:hypothetical protein F4680DRAFT_446754 [Xylaria scruposa]